MNSMSIYRCMFPYGTYKFKNYFLEESCDEFIVRAEHRQREGGTQKSKINLILLFCMHCTTHSLCI